MFRNLALSTLFALVTLTPAWADDSRDYRQPRRDYERQRDRRDDRREVWQYYVEGGGRFEHQRGDRWLQIRNYGEPILFRETGRTRDYVELYDPQRRMYVRLHEDQWYQNDPTTGWIPGAAGHWD
jgi:hypothetical protein